MEGHSPEKNIVIEPHDVIAVPRAELVYVIGEVGKTGPIPLSGGHSISALEAVSSSGGVLRTAAPSHTRILRQSAGSQKRTEIDIDLKRIMQGKANDMTLLPGDILVVPDSGSKRAVARAVEAAIQMGTIIGTYGVIR
jgi:polysaccharide export outer membrane protein